jgi:hypothetical protein
MLAADRFDRSREDLPMLDTVTRWLAWRHQPRSRAVWIAVVATLIDAFTFPGAARAGFVTAADLALSCRATPLLGGVAACTDYIAGSFDALMLAARMAKSGDSACAEGLRLGDLRGLVLGFIAKHPQQAELPAEAVIWNAVSEALPCVALPPITAAGAAASAPPAAGTDTASPSPDTAGGY